MASLPIPSVFEVERAFADAMHAAGYSPGAIQADTQEFIRFDAPGDKKGRETGFYKLRIGQFPVGWFGDWRTGQSVQWQWDHGRELTAKERKHIKDEHRRLKHEAEVAREVKHREVAERASAMWKKASADVEGHPYLKKKSIDIARGLRLHTAQDGTALLLVPIYVFDHAGNPDLVNLQMISPDGAKRFLAGGRVEGGFFTISGENSIRVVCEGVATGFRIWQATGLSVAMAFNAGNLIEVCKEIARYRPLVTQLIAGDDDVVEPENWPAERPWKNAGRLKAEAAARAVGCRWVVPVFKAGPDRSRTDFDDLAREEGLEMVGAQIFGAIRSIDPEPDSPGAEIIEPSFIQDESWRSKIPLTSNGKYDAANVQAVAVYMEHHPLLRGRLAFNLFTQAMELDGNDLADHHVAEFRRLMHADGLKAKKGDVTDEMVAEARRRSYDPLVTYLSALKWDGQKRLDHWLTSYIGCASSTYTRTVGRKFMVGAVARALSPGCKNDVALIFEGPQGAGKSTAARYLFGDRFFMDNLPDFHSKDSFQYLQGYWCVEIAELSAMSKADIGDVKKFLSRLVDVYRPPYGKLPIKVPRRCVFVGTVNPEDGIGYLKDPTGGRRFWPVVTCEEGPIRLNALLGDRDQLWAEAVQAFRSGEPWHLTTEEEMKDASEQQEARREIDAWEAPVADWMADNLGVVSITIERALSDIVKVPVERQDDRARRRMGRVLRACGWDGKVGRAAGSKPVLIFHRPDGSRRQGEIFLPEHWA